MQNFQNAQQAESNLSGIYGAAAGSTIGGVVGYAQTVGERVTIEMQAVTLESYIGQLVELCERAEITGNKLLGGPPTGAPTPGQTPKAVPAGLLDRIDMLSREFSGAIGRMERALQRIGDSL